MATITDLQNNITGLSFRQTVNDNFDNLNNDKAESTVVTALGSRVTTAEGDITALQTAVGDANSGIISDINHLNDHLNTAHSLLLTGSNYTTQTPTGTDAPMQISFGASVNDNTDPVSLYNDGVITFHESGTYIVNVSGQYGRTGSSGTSHLYFRAIYNGSQLGNTIEARLDDANTIIPYNATSIFHASPGDTLYWQMVRDSAGADYGDLVSSTPTLAGWAATPSASISIYAV